eukprot:7380180-Prymnesium_polylepis.2
MPEVSTTEFRRKSRFTGRRSQSRWPARLDRSDQPGAQSDAWGGSHALTQANQCLQLEVQRRLLPYHLCTAQGLTKQLDGSRAGLAPVQGTATSDNRDEKREEHGHCNAHPDGDVVTIVAARCQLVKVPGICRTVAQLAAWASIAVGAVAVPLVSRIVTTDARAPTPIHPATIYLRRCRRVAPVARYQVERRGGCGRVASDWCCTITSADGAAQRTARVRSQSHGA